MTQKWPSLIIAILLLVISPMFLVLIFLAGDSCCGENTSGAMAGVTFASLILAFAIASGLHRFVRALRKTPKGEYGIISHGLVSTIPSAVLCLGFLLMLTWQWLV